MNYDDQSMKNEPLISIVVVEFYQDNNFIRCMKTLTPQDYQNYEIILVCGMKAPLIHKC